MIIPEVTDVKVALTTGLTELRLPSRFINVRSNIILIRRIHHQLSLSVCDNALR